MLRKTTAVAIGAAGYVLGARAGRGRYEQIRTQVQKVWGSPVVQDAASQVQDFAEQQAPVVKDKAADVADQAASKVKDAAGKAKDAAMHSSSNDVGSDGAGSSGTSFDNRRADGIDLVAAASTTPDDDPHV